MRGNEFVTYIQTIGPSKDILGLPFIHHLYLVSNIPKTT